MNESKAIDRPEWCLHVATHGSENGDGSQARPFATPQQARDALRARRQAGGATVWLHGGEYRLAEPLVFTAEDGGTPESPVVYRAVEGDVVSLNGGVRLRGWKPVSDPAVLERLDPAARGQVWQTDLRAQRVDDFGVMESAPNWNTSDPGLEVFFRGERMTLARYPNDGFLNIAALSVEDGYDVRGNRGSRTGRFRIESETERLRRWAAEPDVMLHGYWFWDWADQRLAVKAIEPETDEIVLDDRRLHEFGYRIGQWFYAFNLLCELDQPGEWFLDRQTGILYFWPPEKMADGDVTVSVLRDPVAFENASHITFQGFTLETARGTAIQVSGGEAVRIAGCTIRNVGADAIRGMGGARHTVCDCDIYHTGDGGIQLNGGDRRTLAPGRHEALNNHIHHIACWNPHKVGIQLRGCGNRAAYNRLHDLPHVAIGFTGNDQMVEFNEIYQAITGSNDAGAIYTCGAHPEDWSMRGHRVRFNYLHHLFGFAGEGCSGIYLDDMFSGTLIHGNLLWRVSQGFLLGGGRDILSTNNLFVDCPRAISLDARAIGWAAPYLGDVFAGLAAMPYGEEPWASRYPELVNILADEPVLPKGNVIARNIVRGGGGIWVEDGAQPGLRLENNLDQEDPGFADEGQADWRLREDSPAIALGFEPLPLGKIGLQISPLRPSLPPRRLFEAELVVETLPLRRHGKPCRPGVIRVRVRNLGERPDSAMIRLRVCGGRLEGDGLMPCSLVPFATTEQRFALSAATDKVRLQILHHGVDGVLDARTLEVQDEAVTPWPATLSVSALQPGAGRLESLDRVPPEPLLHWRPRATDSASGFCNLHDILGRMGEIDAVAWIGARVCASEPMRVAVLLGYDGPVRLFVDGVAVFHDPAGTNPARPDAAAPEVALAAGEHRLAVALGANQGRAWGLFLRLRRVDSTAEGEVVLPTLYQEKCTCLS